MEPLREWTVAGGVVERDDCLLLVRNVRRGGYEDWSTPGGVIDDVDVDLRSGLTREVEEETGLRVRRWDGPVYEVRAEAPDMRWRMRCEVHVAVEFEGELRVGDPDGIVTEVAFVPADRCLDRLAAGPPWVREPLAAWLRGRWGARDPRTFAYEVRGTAPTSMSVRRTR